MRIRQLRRCRGGVQLVGRHLEIRSLICGPVVYSDAHDAVSPKVAAVLDDYRAYDSASEADTDRRPHRREWALTTPV